MMLKRSTALLISALAAVGCEGASPSPSIAQARTVPQTNAANSAISATRRTAITQAVEKVAPAVVTVQTESVERVPVDMFEYFWGNRSGERKNAGIGSGFIIRNDGVIVTNAHVVSGATKVSIGMRDGTTYPAKVIGVDETNDLAVLKIEAKNMPTAPLGTSSDLVVGEWTIAIGNPFGFVLGNSEPSVSVGVVSAVGRNLAGRGEGGGVYVDMIQTDAAINPGNSGGPLINAVGDVIGVNSSIYSPSGGSIGLGFAIPIDRTKRIAEDLLDHGYVRQPWVGLRLRAVDAQSAREAATTGAIVARVIPGSPAAKAGVEVGDQIVRAATRNVRNSFDWEARLLDLRVGETLPISVKRGGKDMNLSLTVADAPEVGSSKVTVLKELELISLTEQIRQERGIRNAQGALVYKVPDNISDQLGLQAGDLIVRVGTQDVASAEAVKRALDAYTARTPIVLYIERGQRILQTPPFTFK